MEVEEEAKSEDAKDEGESAEKEDQQEEVEQAQEKETETESKSSEPISNFDLQEALEEDSAKKKDEAHKDSKVEAGLLNYKVL